MLVGRLAPWVVIAESAAPERYRAGRFCVVASIGDEIRQERFSGRAQVSQRGARPQTLEHVCPELPGPSEQLAVDGIARLDRERVAPPSCIAVIARSEVRQHEHAASKNAVR